MKGRRSYLMLLDCMVSHYDLIVRSSLAAAVDSMLTTFKVIERSSFDCDGLIFELNEENDYDRVG